MAIRSTIIQSVSRLVCLMTVMFAYACAPPGAVEDASSVSEESNESEPVAAKSEAQAEQKPQKKRRGISAPRPKKKVLEEVPKEKPPKAPERVRPVMAVAARQAYEAGVEAFDAADMSGAIAQFKRSIQKDSRAYEAFAALAMVQERTGDISAAQVSYKRSLRISEDYGQALRGYLGLLSRDSGVADALTYIEDVASRHKKSPEVLAAHAEVLSLAGRSQDAQDLARSALKLNPNFAPAMMVLAQDHFRNRRLDLALYTLKGILDGQGADTPARDPGNPDGHLLRGVIYLRLGEVSAGMNELKLSVKARPDLVQAHLVLAAEMMSVGNVDDAMQHLRMAIAFENSNIQARQLLGDAYRALGKPELARLEFEWVIQANPGAVGAHYNLALLLITAKSLRGLDRMGALKLAILHLELYLERVPRGGAGDAHELLESANLEKVGLEFEAADAARADSSNNDFSDESFSN